jgi:hypothetical protein
VSGTWSGQSADGLDQANRERARHLAQEAVTVLRAVGVRLGAGMSREEIEAVQARFGIRFGPEHRMLLSLAVPEGRDWPPWRANDPAAVHRSLQRPVDGVLFDVRHNGFWPGSWPAQPRQRPQALRVAGEQLAAWPVLVPLFAHRYLPAAPVEVGKAVLSVWQTDVVEYGTDLVDYLQQEFTSPAPLDVAGRTEAEARASERWVPYWSDLAYGTHPRDL